MIARLRAQINQLTDEVEQLERERDAAFERHIRQRREEAVERLYLSGLTIMAVARELGITHPTVLTILKRRNVPRRRPGRRRVA